jgi:uncharacterized membrane protein HdeD (DUF308 family)
MTDATMVLGSAGEIRKHTGWFIVLGVVFVIGGILAIAMPLLASITVALVVGWALIVLGIVTIAQTWSMRTWGGFAWQLIIGLVFLLGGLDIVFNPVSGAITLTFVIGIVFIVKGVMQLVIAWRYRPRTGWGWMAVSGVIALIVGLMILSSWPFSGFWVPGTLAGISLVFSGWSYIMVALAARRLMA